MGGSGNFKRVQQRADDLITAGQERHGDESLAPEGRFSFGRADLRLAAVVVSTSMITACFRSMR
jgi:hypothetical protein